MSSLDATVNDVVSQATSAIDNISGQNATSLSATTSLANELKQSIEALKLEQVNG
ncbi:hypothetical protein JCM19236_3620 [Vibrio sp. JCM 19236]|nr:hypothetical protein JCM19236_3620 [Vibrio sp. JCM 19236]